MKQKAKNRISYLNLKAIGFKKIDASLMLYAIFILVVVLLILSGFFLHSMINRQTIASYQIQERLRQNVSSGINLLLADSTFQYNRIYYIDMFNENIDSLSIKKKKWGLLDLLSSKSWHKSYSKERYCYAGGFYKRNGMNTLYLADNGSPLCVCGNTKITGDCIIPKSGIKRGYIEGRHYSGDDLIKGNITFSEDIVPALPQQDLKLVEDQLSIDLNLTDYDFINLEEITKDSLYRSFTEKPLLIYQPESLLIDNYHLTGNILLVSNEIIVGPESSLNDVVLLANNIFILPETKARIQCIASDTIWVGENCYLAYPSVLAVLSDSLHSDNKMLMINANSRINGIVADLTKAPVQNQEFFPLYVDEGVIINGQLFSTNSVQFLGKVHGQVITNKFRLQTPSSLYINHLLDVEIDINKLGKTFVGLAFEGDQFPKKVIKWLH